MVHRLLDAADLDHSGDPRSSRGRLLEAIVDPGVSMDPAEDAAGRHDLSRLSGLHGEAARRFVLELLDEHGAALADRVTLPGHLTGSALVLDPAASRVLLMLHAKLGRWLQPGGHADGDHELAGVALREATEETGIEGLRVMTPAIDLDVHLIPARGDEPEHLHLDLRFVVVAPRGARPVSNHESRDLRWVPIEEVPSMTDEVGLLRLVERGLAAYDAFSSDRRGEHTSPSG